MKFDKIFLNNVVAKFEILFDDVFNEQKNYYIKNFHNNDFELENIFLINVFFVTTNFDFDFNFKIELNFFYSIKILICFKKN